MVGSYAPKRELQSFITPMEDAPSGMFGSLLFLAYRHYSGSNLND